MRFKAVVGALLCACLATSSAFAGQQFAPNLVPAVRLGLSFGGPDARTLPFQLALQMQNRAVITQKIVETAGEERIDLAPLSLDMITLSGSRAKIRSAYVFASPDLLAGDRALNANGESKGNSNWIWWTLGGVAAAAATALAVGSGGNEININGGDGNGNGGGDGGTTKCTIVGGTYNLPDDIHPVVVQGCPGVPDVP